MRKSRLNARVLKRIRFNYYNIKDKNLFHFLRKVGYSRLYPYQKEIAYWFDLIELKGKLYN
mgnify:CR=1 FL=1